FELRRPEGDRLLFGIAGGLTPPGEEKLRAALKQVDGMGEIMVRRMPRGVTLGIVGGLASPEAIIDAAKAAGFRLTRAAAPGGDSGTGERIAPPAPGERIAQDLTRVGEPAPDFTLLAKDGQTRITLSASRGKKPVVLLFG